MLHRTFYLQLSISGTILFIVLLEFPVSQQNVLERSRSSPMPIKTCVTDLDCSLLVYNKTRRIMLRTGKCHNCGAVTTDILCNVCKNYRRCTRCYRYLPAHLYDDSDVCNACQNRDQNNVGCYCLDQVLGDRTWNGNSDDICVSDFVQRHADDIRITFETARNEHINIKYYMEIEVEFHLDFTGW